MKFLTAFDDTDTSDRSIDPLGLTPIWTGFARRFVSNLTTGTTSIHDAATVLLAGVLATDQPNGDGILTVKPFLRFEQLAAFTRVHFQVGQNVRGIRLVKKLLTSKLRIDHNMGILSNQRAYGIWGSYTGPMAQSKLLDDIIAKEGYVLSEEARDTVISLLHCIGRGRRDRLRSAIQQESVRNDAAIRVMMQDLYDVFKCLRTHKPMRTLIREQFAKGVSVDAPDDVKSKQQLLYKTIQQHRDIRDITTLRQLLSNLPNDVVGTSLSHDLEIVIALDKVLSNARFLFDFLRHRTFSVNDIKRALKNANWRSAHSNSEAEQALTGIQQGLSISFDATIYRHWHRYLHAGDDVETLVDALISTHQYIVSSRNSSLWIDRTVQGQYHPIQRNGAVPFLAVNDGSILWFGFFLPSLQKLKNGT